MTIDILGSDCAAFLELVEQQASNPAEAQRAARTVDAVLGVLRTLSHGCPNWVPDNRRVSDADTCVRLLSAIRSLQGLSARYGQAELLRKLSDVCGRVCLKLARGHEGPLAETYADLHAQIATSEARHPRPDLLPMYAAAKARPARPNRPPQGPH